MSVDNDTQRFLDLFHQVFLRFHQRSEPGDYHPSLEVLGVLEHLAASGPLTVTEAARHFKRSQSAMSELLDRLEKRGVVERNPDERDRRRSLVWLSKDGLELWRRSNRVLSLELLQPIIGRLGDDEVRALLSGLEALVDRSGLESDHDERDSPETPANKE
jgi:DNA-binding MarR family transcriptional regulator